MGKISVFPVPVSSMTECNANITKDTMDCKSAVNHQDALNKLCESLRSIEKLYSIHDVNRVNSIVDDSFAHLPGPATPEKLYRFDFSTETDWTEIAENEYAAIQYQLIRLFDHEWPVKSVRCDQKCGIISKIFNLFSMDHSADFVLATVTNIFEKENHSKFDRLVTIFEHCLRSETWLLAAFLDYCYAGNISKSETECFQYDEKRDQLIQLLIAAPNKIANYFAGKHPRQFDPERFSGTLLVALIQSIYFIAEKNKLEQKQLFETKFLGRLLGRIAVDYNMNRKSKVLQETFQLLSILAAESNESQNTIRKMILQIPRHSYDIVAWYVFSTENPIDLLGDAVKTSEDWYFVLKNKFILSTPGGFLDDTFIRKLVEYLSANLIIEKKIGLLEDVARKWSSKVVIKMSNIEEQLYYTKVLILGVETFALVSSEIACETFCQIIHNGVRNRMEILDEKVRAIGMITAEIILNKLNAEDEDSKLRFEYDGFMKEVQQLVEQIKNVHRVYESNAPTTNGNSVETSISVLQGISQGKEEDDNPKELKINAKPSLSRNIQNTAIEIGSISASAKKIVVLATPKIDLFDDDDLDSDDEDDLKPYDMSNDTPLVEEKRPRYLRDIHEALLETEDPDVFEQTIISCASLVEEKLPDDQSNIGVELLELLIALDERFHVDEFDYHQMSSCVAICCIVPKDSAEFLCKEIHAEQGRYSIGKKILMMEILGETAKILSKLTKQKEKPPKRVPSSETIYSLQLYDQINHPYVRLNEAKRVIQERIEKKTRRFKHPTVNIIDGTKPNKFSEVAGFFFFPLLYGIGKDELKFHGLENRLKHDTDNILLLNLLRTIATITYACQNCQIISKIAPEVFELGFTLRFHGESKIRLAVLHMLAAALLVTPKSLLQLHFSVHLAEMKNWLEEYLSLNITKGERDDECRKMASNLLAMCMDALTSDV